MRQRLYEPYHYKNLRFKSDSTGVSFWDENSNWDLVKKEFYKYKNLITNDFTENDNMNDEVKEKFGKEMNSLLSEANDILNGKFTIFFDKFDNIIDARDNIRWHYDFINNKRFPSDVIYSKISQFIPQGADIKSPWELSRMHHLVVLGEAYSISREKKFANKIKADILHWIKENPVGYGVNWACTMDVGIRITNMLLAIEFLDKKVLDNNFLKKFFITVEIHGQFIRHHLENKNRLVSNHYLGNLLGLLMISLRFPFLKEASTWKKFALQELFTQLYKQVYQDGVDFESSTGYHLLVLEFYIFTLLACKRAKVPIPRQFEEKIKKMVHFELCAIDLDSQVPQIGDDDSGRLFKFYDLPPHYHGYILDLATLLFSDSKFKLSKKKPDLLTLFIFGSAGIKKWLGYSKSNDIFRSHTFEDAGWAILRDSTNYCFFSCGPVGQGGKGGHSHNDKLSIVLILDGEKILVDPGTFVYTSQPKWRNKFRSTRYHNTLMVDANEQNGLEFGIFELVSQSIPKIGNIISKLDNIVVSGKLLYDKGFIHSRKIKMLKGVPNIEITDDITGNGENRMLKADIIFNLAPGCKYDPQNKVIEVNGKYFSLQISEKGKISQLKSFYSPHYGKKVVCIQLRIEFEFIPPFTNLTTIQMVD